MRKPILNSTAWRKKLLSVCVGSLVLTGHAHAQNESTAPDANVISTPTVAPSPTSSPAVPVPTTPPPTAQAYIKVSPPVKMSYGHTMLPITFLTNGLGASAGPVSGGFWRIIYFNHTVEIYPYQKGARFDGKQVTLPTVPLTIDNVLYVPLAPITELFGVSWKVVAPANGGTPNQSTLLVQYPAAYIESVRSSIYPDKVRTVLDLSNPTRIVASQQGLDVHFNLAAARRPNTPTVQPINDYLVARAVTRSGNWQANFTLRINYAAPVQWFTLGSPPRLVIDVQRLFEQQSSSPIDGSLKITKILKGTSDGPVQMYLARINPEDGWRMRVVPGGYSVLQRNRPSQLASRHKALMAVNGGFFAYDGAAVGALQVDGEWIRLPWKGRTAVAFRPDGEAKIGNLQVNAYADFSGGLRIPIRDLNGWPDKNRVTALTRRLGSYYKLKPGEMALEIKNGVVVGKPGGGGVHIYPDGFTLVASGGARPWLNKVQRGERASLNIQAPGWQGYTSSLGGGPRLVNNGQVEVTALREAFKEDVRVGRGPRTAFGIDKDGHYILLVVDGREKYHSIGLTLTELAYTMQKLGAVDALNLDGGGSTALAIRNHVINHPSDGYERSVSNALLVMR